MSREELLSEIMQLIETAPESVLLEVLEFLREANEQAEAQRAKNLNRILQEDRELLKRLAQ